MPKTLGLTLAALLQPELRGVTMQLGRVLEIEFGLETLTIGVDCSFAKMKALSDLAVDIEEAASEGRNDSARDDIWLRTTRKQAELANGLTFSHLQRRRFLALLYPRDALG